MKHLTTKQLQRNSLQMSIAYNNSIDAINSLLDRKEKANQRIVALVEFFNHNGGKKNNPIETAEYEQLRSFVSSFGSFVTCDGRMPQNKGMRQMMAYGKTSTMANTIWGLTSVEHAQMLLLSAIDFKEDLRLKDTRTWKCSQINVMYVHAVGHDGRPLSWSWVPWDGLNHSWIWEHNEGLTFEGTKTRIGQDLALITTAGEYLVAGLKVYVREQDIANDWQVTSGMNYNLRIALSAIKNNYAGVTNWQE
jgi:hypothetical protein